MYLLNPDSLFEKINVLHVAATSSASVELFLVTCYLAESLLYFQRITIREIKSHPWFLKNLPRELTEAAQLMYYRKENPTFSFQSVDDVVKIVEEAKAPACVSRPIGSIGWGEEEDGDAEEETEEEDEYEKTVKEAHASGEVHVT